MKRTFSKDPWASKNSKTRHPVWLMSEFHCNFWNSVWVLSESLSEFLSEFLSEVLFCMFWSDLFGLNVLVWICLNFCLKFVEFCLNFCLNYCVWILSEFSISPCFIVFLVGSDVSDICLNFVWSFVWSFCLNFVWSFVWILSVFYLSFGEQRNKTPKKGVRQKNVDGKSILRDKFRQVKHLSNSNAE